MNPVISIYLVTYSRSYLFLALVIVFVHKDVREGKQPLVKHVGVNKRQAFKNKDGRRETFLAHYVNSAIIRSPYDFRYNVNVFAFDVDGP